MKTFYCILILLISIFIQKESTASHLIVGEMTYKHLGNYFYEFTIYYYRDCRPYAQGGGHPAAIQSDDPLFVSIYNGQNFISFDSVQQSEMTILPSVNPNGCENSPDSTCINRIKFKLVKYLPLSLTEYTILNERCCMNESISNLANAGTKGHRFYCKIPPGPLGVNTSAVFSPVTDTRFCAYKKYIIDHSATDTDGDSLSYGFSLPESGGDANDPKPFYYGGPLPVLKTLNYLPPYSVYNPMPGMSINEKTGIISLNATIQGTFVVSVYCNEWRNGTLINTIKRTFVYTVSNCNFEVSAQISCDTNLSAAISGKICLANCDNKTISFKNKSTGAIAYHWDFGDNALQDDTSNVADPIYTYADTGRYKVTMIAYGNNCTDSIIEYVSIFNDVVSADFTYSGKLCTGNTMEFNSTTGSLDDTIMYWKWDFINPALSFTRFDENPDVLFEKPGIYQVTLNAYNSYGCAAAQAQAIDITSVNVTAYHDTVIHCGSEINLFATGADNYFWYISPGVMSSVTPDNTANTTFWCHETIPQRSIVYVKGTNSDGCTGIDSVKVNCINEEIVFVPTAFSPNGDRLNDKLGIHIIGGTLNYFRIYNRRGQQVFSTTDPNYGWDGELNGRPMGIDSYYWVASIINLDGVIKIYKGDIVLVR